MAVVEKEQIKLTFLYDGGDARTYTITKKNSGTDYDDSDLKERILKTNAAMPEYFSQTFVSEWLDPLVKISDAQYIITEEEIIYGHQ